MDFKLLSRDSISFRCFSDAAGRISPQALSVVVVVLLCRLFRECWDLRPPRRLLKNQVTIVIVVVCYGPYGISRYREEIEWKGNVNCGWYSVPRVTKESESFSMSTPNKDCYLTLLVLARQATCGWMA